MKKFEKEMKNILDGLIVLYDLINNKEDLNKASDVVHDLLLGYGVTEWNKDEYKKGLEDVEEMFVDMPRQDGYFDKNDFLAEHIRYR
jgi:hypothetical protein